MTKSVQGNFKNLKIENIDELRTVPGAYIGQSADVSGYYETGDGGGGPERYWAEGSLPGTYIDNKCSIIVLTGGDGSSAWLFKTSVCNIDIRWAGASISNTAVENTNAITIAASLSKSNVFLVVDGEYETSYTSDTTPNFIGCGTLITDSGLHKRAKNGILIDSQPASFSNGNSIVDDFDNSASEGCVTNQISIKGSNTVGEPTTGYMQSNAVCPDYTRVHYESGHNESSGSLEGRTGWAAKRVNITHGGRGDVSAYNVNMFMSNNEGFASLLGEPAGNIINGQITAGADDVVLNIIEMNSIDNGYDVLAKGPVYNFFRENDTAAKGQFWSGIRCQSVGSKNADAAFQVIGGWKVGLDTTGMTGGVDAIILKEEHKISFDGAIQALPGAPGYKTFGVAGSTFIGKQSSQMIYKFEGNTVMVYTGIFFQVNPIFSVALGIKPVIDTSGSVGNASFRFSEIFAVNGTINTSDKNEKTLIEEIPESWIKAAKNIKPKRFKLKDSVRKKGNLARWHIGYIAQDVFEVLKNSGVKDPWQCSFLCKDLLEEVGEKENKLIPLIDKETGKQKERWGIRYSELFALKLESI